MLNRKGSKKGSGPSFCHYCGKQLQLKLAGGFFYKELQTPGEPTYLVRVHLGCVDEAKEEGYKLNSL